MSVNTVLCPKCGLPLLIGATAAARVTCPRCLGEVENPAALPGGNLPRRVVPLDYQAKGDRSRTNALLVLLIPLVAGGVTLTAWSQGLSTDAGSLTLTAIIGALAAYVLAEVILQRGSDSARSISSAGRDASSETRQWLRYFAGLLTGLGISVAFWLVGWKSLRGDVILPLAVAVPLAKFLISIVLLFIPQLKTFGIGLLTSIAIGALIFGFSVVHDILTTPCFGP